MSGITTHVLDTVLGKPAVGIHVRLDQRTNEQWEPIGQSLTDGDGRCRDLTDGHNRGTYRLTFSTDSYFRDQGRSTIYPEIAIIFEHNGEAHYHLPLLLSDNCFTTYRGS